MSHDRKSQIPRLGLFFWTVGPALLLTAAVIGLWGRECWREGEIARGNFCAAFAFVCILGFVFLLNPRRFGWAGRGVAGAIFVAYAWYAVDEWLFSGHPIGFGQARSETTPLNALLGLVFIGLPCLWFALSKSGSEGKPFSLSNNGLDDDLLDGKYLDLAGPVTPETRPLTQVEVEWLLQKQGGAEQQRKGSLDFGREKARVVRIRCKSVLEIIGDEDDGMLWLFDGGSGETICWWTDEKPPVEDVSSWPVDEFEIVQMESTGEVVGLRSLGKTLASVETIVPEEMPFLSAIDVDLRFPFIARGTPREVLNQLGCREADGS